MSADTTKGASWTELYRCDAFGIIVLVSIGAWLHGADELMVSTITPQIIGSIGGEAYVAWLTALYEIGSIVAAACSALAIMVFGLSRVLAGAAFLYAGGCVMSGISPVMELMLAGRLLQGVGGGAMIAIAFVAIQRFAPPHLMARAYAVLSIAWGFAAFAGPMTGALFAEAGNWRLAFYFYALQGLIFGLLALRMIRSGPGDQALPGFPWRIIALALGVLAISQAGVETGAARALVFASAGLALTAAFLVLDSRLSASDRMLPFAPWNFNRPSGAVIILVLFMSISTMGLITYGPLLMYRLKGLGPVQSGGLLLLESVGWSLVAVTVSGFSQRYEKMLILAGFCIVAAGTALFAYAIPYGPVALIAFAALAQGGGFGLAYSFMMRRAIAMTNDEDRERIASAIPTTQRLGYGLGAAFSGMIANGFGYSQVAPIARVEAIAVALFTLSMIPAAVGLAGTLRFVSFKDSAAKKAGT